MKRFNVVIPRQDGGVEVHPMKEWLRQHPQQSPGGLDPSHSTSHQLRNGLKRLGWTVQETATEERLFPPGGSAAAAAVDAVLGEDLEPASIEEDGVEAAFGLEAQLRDFLAQNINKIDIMGKRLKLFVDPTGRDGIEHSTAVGPIDILAVDDTGAFFVFELKRGRTPDHAMGQLTRYMGWVRQTIGKDLSVNGIIVAKEISQNLRYAVSVVPNVSLFEYEVEFHLRHAHDI